MTFARNMLTALDHYRPKLAEPALVFVAAMLVVGVVL